MLRPTGKASIVLSQQKGESTATWRDSPLLGSCGQNSPWLDLIRAEVPTAIIAELFGSGHFPQIEQAEEVSAAIAQFVRRECVQ